jgi:hypothetical protein
LTNSFCWASCGTTKNIVASSTPYLVSALRQTAKNLEKPDVTYRWSSFANCNCGHLIQTVTGMNASEIQSKAMMQEGDWGKQANANVHQPRLSPPQPDFGDRPALDEGAWEPEDVGACQVSGASMDFVFYSLNRMGLKATDIKQLERLSDPEVRRRLGTENVYFPHHVRENVIRYLAEWADMLEEDLESNLGDEGRRGSLTKNAVFEDTKESSRKIVLIHQ